MEVYKPLVQLDLAIKKAAEQLQHALRQFLADCLGRRLAVAGEEQGADLDQALLAFRDAVQLRRHDFGVLGQEPIERVRLVGKLFPQALDLVLGLQEGALRFAEFAWLAREDEADGVWIGVRCGCFGLR
ncbi:MAG: hypothetical protein PHN34_13340, partial [Kiritimatiellae bacterium]|nr:hypothetical protein [Kiritimatiellia bacterium]